MTLGTLFYFLALIAFALVMLEKHVLGLAGIPLLGGGFFCLTLALLLDGIPLAGLSGIRLGRSPPA